MSPIFAPSRARGRLLASAALAFAMFAVPGTALAQSAPFNATGDAVVANSQRNKEINFAQGDDARAEIVVTGPTDGATITLAGNAVDVAARANAAALSLSPDALLTLTARDTKLSAGDAGIEGNANLLIANGQEIPRGSAQANQFNAPWRIALGPVAGSSISLVDNASDALARGNVVTGTITTPMPFGGGAGIVSTQYSGAGTLPLGEFDGIAARVRGGAILESGALAGSRLTVGGNSGGADAVSNAADNAISASIGPGTIGTTNPGPGPVMLVAPVVSNDTVGARFSILNRQSTANVVKARSGYVIDTVVDDGPAVRSTISGDVNSSTVASDGNSLDANAKGNLAANRIDVSGSGDGGSDWLGAIANEQSLNGARIVSSTHGGVAIAVAGDLRTSRLSAGGNAFSSEAAGNVASENRLTVSGNMTGADVAPNATATSQSSSGFFTLDNRQDYGATGITTNISGPTSRIAIAGAIDSSAIDSSDNASGARAVGDSASNTIAIGAGSFDGSAALASRQAGTGRVTATVGDSNAPVGSTIIAGSGVRDSRFMLDGNALSGTAIGSVAVNALGLTVSQVFGNGNGASVGTNGADYGATGTLALVNDQTVGDVALPDGTPAIASNVNAKTGVAAPGGLVASIVDLTGNSQTASALANVASNSVSSATAGLGGASLALSSTQYGQAVVSAVSDATLNASGSLAGSAISLRDNSNAATATINLVENALDLTAATAGATGTSAADTLAEAEASGDAVLANQQFATGSATATAVSRLGVVDDTTIDRSQLSVDGNLVSAEGAGNRASNTLSAEVAAGSARAVIANSQENIASIGASASLAGVNAGGTRVDASALNATDNYAVATARGNAADNVLDVAGVGSGDGAAVTAGRRWANASGNAVIANAQTNYAAVNAYAGEMVALNVSTVSGSTLSVANNAMAATAYGNIATNTITATVPITVGGLGVTSAQANYGPVTATVVGAGSSIGAASINGSMIGITGNRLSATATGNQASSAIVSPR